MQSYEQDERDARADEYDTYNGFVHNPERPITHAVFPLYMKLLLNKLNIRYLTERDWFNRDLLLQDLLRHVVVDLRMGQLVNVEDWDLRKHLERLVARHAEESDGEVVVWYADQIAKREAERKEDWDALHQTYLKEDLERRQAEFDGDREADREEARLEAHLDAHLEACRKTDLAEYIRNAEWQAKWEACEAKWDAVRAASEAELNVHREEARLEAHLEACRQTELNVYKRTAEWEARQAEWEADREAYYTAPSIPSPWYYGGSAST